MMSVLDKLISPLREFGPWAGILYIIDRGLGGLSPHLRLFVYEIMVQPIPNEPLVPSRCRVCSSCS